MTTIVFPTSTWRLRLINSETGSIARSLVLVNSQLFQRGDALRCCEFDGKYMVSHHIFGGANRMTRCLLPPGGNIAQVEIGTAHNAGIQDICFDGKWWWRIHNTNFRKYTDWTFAQTFTDAISHGLTQPRGIMWMDGKLGVLA